MTDSRFQPELRKFQDENTDFCVIKDFYKIGSVVFGWNRDKNPEVKSHALRCALFAKPGIQVVRLGGPDCLYMYSEYAPYTIVEDGMEAFMMCKTGNVPGEDNPYVRRPEE